MNQTEIAMKAVVRIIVVTAAMAGALSSGAARADEPGPALQFELADGTVITGRLDAKTIAIRISSGNVLKVPAAEVGELTVGASRGQPLNYQFWVFVC